MSPGQSRHLEGLQYLRALGALICALGHALYILPSAPRLPLFGVEIFFVISGFVTALAHRRLALSLPPRRRAALLLLGTMVRLLPLYWFALLLSMLPWLVAWVNSADNFQALYWNFGPRLQGFLLDFLMIPRPNPDFGGLWRPHLLPGWTLNLQLVLSALFALAMLAGRFQLPALCTVITAMVAATALWPGAPGLLQFYGQPMSLAFLVGVLLHHAYCRWPPETRSLVLFLLLLFVAASGFVWAGLQGGSIALTLVSAAGVWLFLGMPLASGRWARLARQLGDGSYPIYLFHAALVFPLLQWVLKLWSGGAGGMTAEVSPSATGALLALYVVASALVGLLIHRALELPLLGFIRRRWRPESSRIRNGQFVTCDTP